MTDRWLLERDFDDEVITAGRTVDAALIEGHLNSFDGEHVFYTALFHDPDEACIWCVGEPDARLLEARLVEPDYKHVTLKSSATPGGKRLSVRVGPVESPAVVTTADLFSREQTLEIFLHFFETRALPESLAYDEGKRLFS